MCDKKKKKCKKRSPQAQIFQEKLCGNFKGISDPATAIPIWSAPLDDYIQGTFEVFNSSASTGPLLGTITSQPSATDLEIFPGNSQAKSVLNPTSFTITAGSGDSGTWCINLYKRIQV
ncbi:S-Ena type endospore appendage [Rossellomorea oryzaecorticis]|uniref:S-Ena type endospore appendage n=1 Tax=Rossellomorea oryzaecorticis TaxID=1396505 RepID=A0ABU9KB36_9BACI